MLGHELMKIRNIPVQVRPLALSVAGAERSAHSCPVMQGLLMQLNDRC